MIGRLRAPARLLGRLAGFVGWFIVTQAVTVVALALLVVAAWLIDMRAGLIVCAVCLVTLERKVELDRR